MVANCLQNSFLLTYNIVWNVQQDTTIQNNNVLIQQLHISISVDIGYRYWTISGYRSKIQYRASQIKASNQVTVLITVRRFSADFDLMAIRGQEVNNP